MKYIIKIGAYVLFVLLMYVLVNDPFWVPTYGILGRASRQHGVVLLMLLSVIYISKHMSGFKYFVKLFRTEFLLMFVLIIYGLLLIGRSMSGLGPGIHIEMLFQTALIPFCLISYAIVIGINNENSFIRSVLIMSAVGGVLSTLCLLNPSFDAFVKDSILQISEEDKLAGYTFRAFGVASGLLYGYGVAQGIAMSLGIFYISQNKWYLFFIPFVFVSIIFNARTGFLLPIFATLIYFFSSKNRPITIAVTIFFVGFLINSRDFIALFGNEKSAEWIGDFFDQLVGIAQSGDYEDSSTLTHLFRSNLWPTSIDGWVMGTGIDISGLSNNSQSDIGFMRQLHYGGLLYCISLYWLIMYMLRRLWRYRYRNLSLFFLFTFIIANLKGLYAPLSNGFILFALVYYYLIYIKIANRNMWIVPQK